MKLINSFKLMMFIFVLVSLTSSAFALGITPSKKTIEFSPNMHEAISFRIINSENKDVDIIIYPRGELAEFVKLDKTILHMSKHEREKTITYEISLPASLKRPGVNLLEIVVEEAATSLDKPTSIAGKIALIHQLLVKSPSNGQYATVIFSANNPEQNQELQFTYSLFNEGDQDIAGFSAELEIYDASGLVGKETYDFLKLKEGEVRKEIKLFSQKLAPGEYRAVTKISYAGKIINMDTNFVVGGSLLEIQAISSPEFKLSRINKLNVALFNKGTQQLNNVFAEIIVKDNNEKAYSIFKTLTADIPASSGGVLFGYWDTSTIPVGQYLIDVKAKYGSKVSEKVFEVFVSPMELKSSAVSISGGAVTAKLNGTNSLMPILTVAFIILMIVNVLLIIFLRKGKTPPKLSELPPIQSLVVFIAVAILYKLLI